MDTVCILTIVGFCFVFNLQCKFSHGYPLCNTMLSAEQNAYKTHNFIPPSLCIPQTNKNEKTRRAVNRIHSVNIYFPERDSASASSDVKPA